VFFSCISLFLFFGSVFSAGGGGSPPSGPPLKPLQLYVVNGLASTYIRDLACPVTIDRSTYPSFTIAVTLATPYPNCVAFFVNGNLWNLKNLGAPFSIAGDDVGAYYAWAIPAGTYNMEVRGGSSCSDVSTLTIPLTAPCSITVVDTRVDPCIGKTNGLYCDCTHPTDYLQCDPPFFKGLRPCPPGTYCTATGGPSAFSPCGFASSPPSCSTGTTPTPPPSSSGSTPTPPPSSSGSTPSPPSNGKKGLTWLKKLHYATEGVDLVGCFYGSVPPECDPYLGDTLCTESRPVLCIKVDGTNRPHYPRWSTLSPFYYGWSEGSIDLSPSVLGTSLTSLAAANQVCSDSFGAGWRMAEFHDGLYAGTNPEEPFGSDWAITPKSHGGWHINAFGNVRSDTKYWVSINDQQANCWN